MNRDCPCITCGYDLRGTGESGACPECGTPVIDSKRAERLVFADEHWLRKLALGARLLALSIWIQMAVILTTMAAQAAGNWRFSMATTRLSGPALDGLLFAAVLLLTARGDQSPSKLRPVPNGLALLALLLSLALVFAPPSLFVLHSARSVVQATTFILLVLYLRPMAARVPAPRLAWQLGATTVPMMLLILVTLSGVGYAIMYTSVANRALLQFLVNTTMTARILGFLSLIWIAILMHVFDARVRRILRAG